MKLWLEVLNFIILKTEINNIDMLFKDNIPTQKNSQINTINDISA